jgi:uncharacterized protein YndB with AHSA1/START domain
MPLEKNIITELATDRELAMTCFLDTPLEPAWIAWTDAKQLAQWWGPSGFTNPRCEIDVRPAGAIRIDMRGPDGTVYPMSGAYRKVVRLERLTFVSSALDKNGNPLFEVMTTVAFT